ncbi:hypothetical protein BA953_22735 [Vibrio coralliilyticus]|uniref:hypothetical protein n=1 Tax=Vibrio coralliilyticus TaxID=190893 RepID=UPI000810EF79|nr:hypothetical protein [Vibrio coralliilyticus]ANW26952.1 hypothetical protein BA953_22735 [Vibrio coralliilyticus]
MSILKTKFTNCYGIKSLVYDFDFSGGGSKAYAIYAPNGLMKTSFTRTFLSLSEGKEPKEERFNRPTTFEALINGEQLSKDSVYILKSEIDTNSDDESVSNLLINRESKKKYDSLVEGVQKTKSSMISKLQKASGVKQKDIEQTLLKDFETQNLIEALLEAKRVEATFDSDIVIYSEVFDPKAIEVLDSPEFVLKAKEFVKRYDEVFENSGGLYLKGVFNPNKANASCTSLEKNMFFDAGHTIKVNGEQSDIGLDEFKQKIKDVNKQLDTDNQLNNLKTKLSKNAQTLALQALLENTPTSEAETLINHLNPGKRELFKKELWRMYIQRCPEVETFLNAWEENKTEIAAIEAQAASEAPQWLEAIELFNSRFIDMPFRLGLFNQADAVLGKSKALLKFIFKDGDDIREYTRNEIKALSQGEKRALYLLNFIFDVEILKDSEQPTFFIIDDVADSFDYKNKHAILQYLDDLTKHDNFYQIILTHNFDFYRSLTQFVRRTRCLMANQSNESISLKVANGVSNVFIGLWKDNVTTSHSILYSCVPFTRNLIEYIKGENDEDYLALTKLLHWKEGSDTFTEGQFYTIYNRTFGTNHDETSAKKMIDILLSTANEIANSTEIEGLNLQDKVLMSIAIRVLAEHYITNRLRTEKSDPSFWSDKKSYGKLLGREFEPVFPLDPSLPTLKKISVTVCSNIHLNSFMYEPILDLSIEHLIHLYNEICQLD